MFDNEDPAMQAAYLRARETFRYFWREQFWEYRRIVPGLSISSVKLPFSDGDLSDSKSDVEQMWVNEIDFDGRHIKGTLLNEPNWLKSVKAGDQVNVPVGAISDWMYAIGDDVYGAFSVNVMRAKMGKSERSQHDKAWGLNFGDPEIESLFPDKDGKAIATQQTGLLKRLFKSGKEKSAPRSIESDGTDNSHKDHPMAANMVEKYEEQLSQQPEIVSQVDDIGWTQLHHHALAGSMGVVELLLKLGANSNALTPEGVDAAALARVLQWDQVAEVIEGAQ